MFKVLIVTLCLVAGCIASTALSQRAVDGIVSCGSEAAISDIRVTNCTAVPCQAHVGNTYRIEIDFRPSLSHQELYLNIVLVHGGQNHVIVEGPVPDSGVSAGAQYTFGYSIQITGAFMGEAQVAFNLLGKDANNNDHPELCFYVGIFVRSG